MKKLILILFVVWATNSILAQPWNKDVGHQPNFFELQQQFNEYWKNNPNHGGAGYNVFKRWEWFWEQRVGLSGEFPAPENDTKEWNKYLNRNLKRAGEPSWNCLGPFNTPSGYNGMGRVNCVAFHPSDKNTFWVGTPSGGLWKTTDFGQSWSTGTDKNPVLGVSSMAVHPLSPDTLYIATGDGDRGSLSGLTGAAGGDSKSIGVLKSDDGGLNWYPTGLNWGIFQTKLIRKLIINPTKPWILLCAASDGVYRTADAGTTWTKVANAYFMDIAYKPDNTDVVYATTYSSGNAQVFRSLDGGISFQSVYTVANGSRITLGVTPDNSSKVHLLVAHKSRGELEGIYQSLDSGTNFSMLYNTSNLLSNTYDGSGTKGQGWYDLSYNILPDNENIIFVGGVNTWKSTDGGSTFELNNMWTAHPSINPDGVTTVHADKHHFISHPLDNSLIFDCNDGGIYYSNDLGVTWNDISENLVITQFYKIAITDQDTGIVLGGTQDNGSRILNGGFWDEATGGDGMEVAIDYEDPDIMYSSYAYGVLYRNDNAFQSWGTVTISNNIPDYHQGAWVTPFLLDPNNSSTIYAGYKRLYKSTDYGENWQAISDSLAQPNLLRNIAIAPGNSEVMYTGDFYGIYRTINGGLNWKKIVASPYTITNIRVSPNNPLIFYYTCSGYSSGMKVFRYDGTLPSGNTINLSGTLPNVGINCLAYYREKSEALYIGTDVGVFYRDSTMNDWISINGNLPNTVVTDIELNYAFKKLVVGTYGRGIWQTDLYGVEYPRISKLVPANKSVSVSKYTPIKIIYDTPVKKGNGTIDIYENSILKRSFSVDSSSIVINQDTVSIYPGYELLYSTAIGIRYKAGTFRDMAGNDALGLGVGQWEFIVENFSGINSLASRDGIKIYPNPASGHVIFELAKVDDNTNYIIFDVNGKRLMEGCLKEQINEVSIDLLETGLYFVRLNINDSMQVFKLMIEH